MGEFTDEQNEAYAKASSHLIKQQILKLLNKIPIAELQKLDDVSKSDSEKMREILQKKLTNNEFTEYGIWAWLLIKIEEINKKDTSKED